MNGNTSIAARLPADTKARFAALARNQGVSESVLLRRLVEAAVVATSTIEAPTTEAVEPVAVGGKISVRLRNDDLLLLRERARARQMPTATYVSLLIRSHLRNLAPIPTRELDALNRSIAEVGAIGRNINQIAHALNSGANSAGPGRADLQAVLRALTGLRDHIKTLIKSNLNSWEAGHEKASR